MAEPKKQQDRDELFWLFPVLLVVAIIAITIFVKPGSCERGPGGRGAGGPVPQGAPQGQVSGVQGESSVVIPDTDESGVRTLDDLSELLQQEPYQQEEPMAGEGTYTDRVTPGPGLRIAIKTDVEEEGNSDIYLIDETGYNLTRLTFWDSVESFPAITTDGTRAYFISDRDDDPNNPNPFTKNTEIYMIDLTLFNFDNPEASPEPVRLTYNNETDYGVSVSADGTRLVYMSATKENPDNPILYLADGDANNGRVIANTRLKNAIPKISGDGKLVVYNSFLDGEMDIYLYNIDGDFTVNLTNSDIPEYFPAINYDGSVIVYEKLLGGTPQAEDFIELFQCNSSGSNEQQITRDRFANTFPAITDDGKYLVFVTKRWDFDGNTHYDEALFYMDMATKEIFKITKDPFYQEQPDV